ncbi:MAG: hypothetical protein KKE37_13545, partial [Verrucomicrobia bacterium]|nr:hypothetical protein [Verrucomicrobiota bacterium]
TGKDGRTALPSDQANTFVLTAKELRDGATVPFTYTIVAANTPDALTQQEARNVAPNETWYRSDPNIPQNTVTIALPPEGAKK